MRRLLTTATVFLACGFAVNILIAWAFAALARPRDSSMFFIAKMRRHYWDDRRELEQSILRDGIWVSDARQGVGTDVIKLTIDTHLGADGQIKRGATLHIQRAGWPLRVMTGFEVSSGSKKMDWAIRAGEPEPIKAGALRGAGDVPPMLPLKPIWPAFALNWLIVSATLSGMWMVQLKIRRYIRRRHRRCWSCGYPMGDSGSCSECGATLDSHTRARNSPAKLTP